ncbi:MAG: DUF1775 domain-containing protein, partial [Actinomycetota bacterium]|nr:DUF1775 domain-containing protein [Actinomycetota bacterium]
MRLRIAALAAALVAVVLPARAAAHVELSPSTVAPGSFTLFTVVSPNEKKQPLTGLRLTIPEGLTVDSAADTLGFATEVVEDQAHRIVALSWQGGRVRSRRLALFHFTASVGPSARTISLTGVQTFADGTTTTWQGAEAPQIEVASPDSGASDGTARILGAAALAAALA